MCFLLNRLLLCEIVQFDIRGFRRARKDIPEIKRPDYKPFSQKTLHQSQHDGIVVISAERCVGMSNDSTPSGVSIFSSICQHCFEVRWVVDSTVQRRVVRERWYGERPGRFHHDYCIRQGDVVGYPGPWMLFQVMGHKFRAPILRILRLSWV